MLTNVITTFLIAGAQISCTFINSSGLINKQEQSRFYTLSNDDCNFNDNSKYNSFSPNSINYTIGDSMERVLIFNNTIEYKGNVVRLKKGISVPIYETPQGYEAENKELEIYCIGSDINELLDEIKESLFVSIELYVKCDINELSEDAVEFRSLLKEYIE